MPILRFTFAAVPDDPKIRMALRPGVYVNEYYTYTKDDGIRMINYEDIDSWVSGYNSFFYCNSFQVFSNEMPVHVRRRNVGKSISIEIPESFSVASMWADCCDKIINGFDERYVIYGSSAEVGHKVVQMVKSKQDVVSSVAQDKTPKQALSEQAIHRILETMERIIREEKV